MWFGANLAPLAVALLGGLVIAVPASAIARRKGRDSRGLFSLGVLLTLGAATGLMLAGNIFLDTESRPAALSAGLGVVALSTLLALAVFKLKDRRPTYVLAGVLAVFLIGCVLPAYSISAHGW